MTGNVIWCSILHWVVFVLNGTGPFRVRPYSCRHLHFRHMIQNISLDDLQFNLNREKIVYQIIFFYGRGVLISVSHNRHFLENRPIPKMCSEQ